MSDTVDQVPADELRDLVDEWSDVYREFAESDGEYSDGVSEGARSAAVELKSVISRHTEGENDD